MNRRKFLNVGGIGLLGLNGMWSAVSSRFHNTGDSVINSFISVLGAGVILDYDTDLAQKMECETLRRFLSIGYQIKKEAYYSKGNYFFLGLELKHNHEICDEVVLTFYQNENLNLTGTINARQMMWFMDQHSNLEHQALQLECDMIDMIIPNSSYRFVDHGMAYYNTCEGTVGFKIELVNNEVNIHGVFKNKEKLTLIEEKINSPFYQKMYTLQTLV